MNIIVRLVVLGPEAIHRDVCQVGLHSLVPEGTCSLNVEPIHVSALFLSISSNQVSIVLSVCVDGRLDEDVISVAIIIELVVRACASRVLRQNNHRVDEAHSLDVKE